jgi:hypothetical protein
MLSAFNLDDLSLMLDDYALDVGNEPTHDLTTNERLKKLRLSNPLFRWFSRYCTISASAHQQIP